MDHTTFARKSLATATATPFEEQIALLATMPRTRIQNAFVPGDIVTQLTSTIDPKDGEPLRAYKFPLPGQPAEVIEILPAHVQRLDDPDKANAACILDTRIRCFASDGIVREFIVGSRHFRHYVPGEGIDPQYQAWVDAQK